VTTLTSRRRAVYLGLSLMTGSWLTAVLRNLLGQAGPSVWATLLGLTLLTLIPLAFSRWLRALRLRKDVRLGALAVGFAFLALLVIASGFYNAHGLAGLNWLNRVPGQDLNRQTFLNQMTSLTLVGVCWWLGITLGNMHLTPTHLLRYFYIGIAAAVLSGIFFPGDAGQPVLGPLFVYLFAGLVTLGLGRVEGAARRSQDRGSPFTAYWLAQLGVTAGIVVAAVGVAQLLGLGRGFGLILVVVAPVIAALVYPVAYIGAKLIALALSAAEFAQPSPDTGPAGGSAAAAPTLNPTSAENICVGLFILLFFAGIVGALVWGTRRWRELVQAQEQEEAGATPAWREQIASAVGERLERLSFDMPGLRGMRRRLAARSIRRIYAALTALGAERGYPRPAARTPYEHLRALQQAFPGCDEPVKRITEAYVAIHYGELPESREALQAVRADWEHVQNVVSHSTLPGSGALAEGGQP
jgi:hypothetical protein